MNKIEAITTLFEKDHDALDRGYICKGCTYAERYNGTFGNGYIIHWENNLHSSKSNKYHVISYYIFK